MADINKTYYCKTCGRTMDGDQFYASNRLDRYPDDGKLPECKKCITRHVDNWNPRTYLWILEEIDVPYIEDEWNKLLEKYSQVLISKGGFKISAINFVALLRPNLPGSFTLNNDAVNLITSVQFEL